ncbi:peptidylprolyl isomerase [Catenovulum sediminis]|uniref:Peptidyl-prolyl cis-trans isomerase n=1 Tax=Catenovulum sediminis TaxID=1740262 RepID=A0ABV1RK72_9ALTE|nr:peptidylprolyl isomerase [Catenovulum sediminis]
MKIEANTVVSMHYQVKNADGEQIDSSKGGEPLAFIHGKGFLIKGLEDQLAGKEAGDKFACTIEPAQAYGEYHEELSQKLPADVFDHIEEIHEGMHLRADTDQGQQSVIITKIEDGFVTVDGNHPLAGLTLEFDVEVVEVRAATEEELAHGHVHGAGGCGH